MMGACASWGPSLSVFLASAIASAQPDRQVYSVDLSQAIARTAEGARLRAVLSNEREAAERRFVRQRAELLKKKKDLSPERYAEAVRTLNEDVARAERALEDKQDRLLAPIIERMRERIARGGTDGVVILSMDREAPIGLPAKCDRTEWLAGAEPAPAGDQSCGFGFFFYVSLERVAGASRIGREARARLDALREARQAEIERKKQTIDRLPAGDPKREALRSELDRAYLLHQQEIEGRTRAEEGAVYAHLRERLETALARLPGALFVEIGPKDEGRLSPRCDATEWAAAYIDGRARTSDLEKLCPAWGG